MYDTLQEIKAKVHETFEKLNCPQLIGQIDIYFNKYFTSKMGEAHYGKKYVCFSLPLWPRASDADRRNTIVHEACHIAQFHLYGLSGNEAHGWQWQKCMALCGEPANRCHNIDRTGLATKYSKVMAQCSCGAKEISSNLATRMKKGARYSCTRCKSAIVIVNENT